MEKKNRKKKGAILFKAKKINSQPVCEQAFLPLRSDRSFVNRRFFCDQSVSSRLKRRSCMFRCSVDQGGRGTQIFALLIRTAVVYYTQVLQVRIEGMELRKGTAKKEMEKNVPSRARKIFVQIALLEVVSFFSHIPRC